MLIQRATNVGLYDLDLEGRLNAAHCGVRDSNETSLAHFASENGVQTKPAEMVRL